MSDDSSTVQEEDAVVETVLDGTNEDVLRLLRERPFCAGLAREIQSVKEGLKSIEEKPAPPFIVESIMNKKKDPFFSGLQDLPVEWYKNPYILSFRFCNGDVFFYFLIVFFLKF